MSQFKEISFLFNIPFLLIILIALLTFYYLLKKLNFNKNISLIALTFIATTPWYVYFTTPTDKLLSVFMSLSLFSLLIYVRTGEAAPHLYGSRSCKSRYFIASAILAALAVLSKLSALFLLPFTLLVLFIYNRKNIKNVIKDYFLWIIIFLITAIIFLPTIIASPETVTNLLLNNSQDRLIINSPSANNSSPFLFITIALTYLSDFSLISLGPFALICLVVFFIFPFFRRDTKFCVSTTRISFILIFIKKELVIPE